MSAWDIAGAVVWTLLAVMFWGTAVISVDDPKASVKAATALAAAFTMAAIFCIARLCGAHA